MPDIASLLHIQPGITSIIGSGGKTTLMMTLARALAQQGTVIITTSTRILPPEGIPYVSGEDDETVQKMLAASSVLCVASRYPSGKLGAPACSFDHLAQLADFVLVEADGSRGLPLKAHASHEPAVPGGSNQTLCVVGGDGFYRPLQSVCHRAEIFAALAEIPLSSIVTPAQAAAVINREGYAQSILINKVETPERWMYAREFAGETSLPVFSGSLQRGVIECLW